MTGPNYKSNAPAAIHSPGGRGERRGRYDRCVPVGRAGEASLNQANSNRAWEIFRNDQELKRVHNISEREMEMLSGVSLMGEARSSRDLVFVLNVLRSVLRS